MINKKIILIGPAGTGKTSIKKTFFEKFSPISLLNEPLRPSRGLNTSIYSLGDSELGVFDLAGQENDLWFKDSDESIFNDSNLIICIFDIHNSVESIIQFLLKVYQIKTERNLKSCHIVAFLHKIDLVSHSYVDRKIKTIYEFMTKQHPSGALFEIYKTSISQQNYYNTFQTLSHLLKVILSLQEKMLQGHQIDEIKDQFILFLDGFGKESIRFEELSSKLNLEENTIRDSLLKLKRRGIVNELENFNEFSLPDSVYFFKFGLEQKLNKGGSAEENLEFETFFLFMILDEVNA